MPSIHVNGIDDSIWDDADDDAVASCTGPVDPREDVNTVTPMSMPSSLAQTVPMHVAADADGIFDDADGDDVEQGVPEPASPAPAVSGSSQLMTPPPTISTSMLQQQHLEHQQQQQQEPTPVTTPPRQTARDVTTSFDSDMHRSTLQSPVRRSHKQTQGHQHSGSSAVSSSRRSNSSSRRSKRYSSSTAQPTMNMSSFVPESWPSFNAGGDARGTLDYDHNDDFTTDDESIDDCESDTSSNLGIIPRRTPGPAPPKKQQSASAFFDDTTSPSQALAGRLTATSTSGYTSPRSPLSPASPSRAGSPAAGTLKRQPSWLGSIFSKLNSLLDPELSEAELFPEGIPDDLILAAPDAPPNADSHYLEGLRLYDSRQYDRAVPKFEQAVALHGHVDAMRLLMECYGPSRLGNTSKAAEWVKRRAAALATPEGMLQHALFIRRRNRAKWGFAGGPSSPVARAAAAVIGSSSSTGSRSPTTSGGSGSEAEAVVLIRNAADLGYAPAMHEFALYLRDNGKGAEAMAWFHRAADLGHAASEEPIAEGYETGADGVAADPIAGAAWRARVVSRKRAEEEERQRRAREEDIIAARVRAESARHARERERLAREAHSREEERKERRALDKQLSGAIWNMEWGFYSRGIEQLHALSVHGNVDAKDFLDADKSDINPLNGTAMFYVGQHFAGLADPVAALRWFRRSAEADYHEGMVTYAAYLIVGRGCEKPDCGQALVWLHKAWSIGRNKEAALALAECYCKGIGVRPDPVKAVTWYTRAWEEGSYPEAAFSVGLAYATGFTPGAVDPSSWTPSNSAYADTASESSVVSSGTTSSGTEVATSESASKGSTPATNNRGSPSRQENAAMSPTNITTAISSASAGITPSPSSSTLWSPTTPTISSPIAQTPVFSPKRILRNMSAVTQNLDLAAMWYRRAAERGHVRASNNLGELYMTGRGVPRDDNVGFMLFKRAAECGLAEALYNVGRCYREGRGCRVDEDVAVSWFIKAEEKGIPEAIRALSLSNVGRKASPKAMDYHLAKMKATGVTVTPNAR